MKVKNTLIMSLAGNGIDNTTNHDVPVKDAYKAFRFKDAVKKAAAEIEKKREGLVKEAGIEDGVEFDAKLKELRAVAEPTDEQKKELSELEGKFEKFQDLWKELMEDETELEGVKTMPYESFHALAKENRNTRVSVPTGEKGKDGSPKFATAFVDVFDRFAGDLEGILWDAPKDEEE